MALETLGWVQRIRWLMVAYRAHSHNSSSVPSGRISNSQSSPSPEYGWVWLSHLDAIFKAPV